MDAQPEGQLLIEPVLTLDGVTLTRRGLPLWAPIDLNVAPGEAVLIRGATGVGKSSLLQLMAGLISPDRGRCMVSGRAALVMQDPDLQLLRDRIGPEVALLLENLGVPPEAMRSRVRHALAQAGLPLPLTHPCRSLSVGQQYRLLLACQLVAPPSVLLLDEPWGQLDDAGFQALLPVLRQLRRQGIALVICDHHDAPYHGLCDRQLTLDQAGLSARPAATIAPPPWPAATPGPARLTLAGELPLGGGQPLRLTSLTLHAGEAVVICGANGAGKTSLVNGIAALGRRRPGGITLAKGSHLGLVGQSPSRQLSATTVEEELLQGLTLQGLTADQRTLRCRHQLRRLGLEPLAGISPQTLSYGQQHLTAIAAQLCLEPDLLLLDDPFAGLDGHSQQRLWLELQRLAGNGAALLITSHRPLALPLAHWHIREGRLEQA